MKVQSHYAKDKTVKEVRYMTAEEAKNLHYGQHVLVLSNHGRFANAKVNGAPKTWKRDSAHMVISLKYGMYEYFQEEFTATCPTTALVVEM